MLSLSGKALVICHPKQTCEGSPGKAKPADLILPWHALRGKPPYREYALPLKRERWHARRAEEGATCLGGFGIDRMTLNKHVIAKEQSDCGNPEDWCTPAYAAAPTFIAGIATLRSR